MSPLEVPEVPAEPNVFSMDDILTELVQRIHEVHEKPKDYIIKGDITAAHLQSLVGLPFEVTITERRGKLVLGTGTAEKSGHGEVGHPPDMRLITSRLAFHTHPTKMGVVFDAPSFADLEQSAQRLSDDERMPPSILGHTKGFATYRIPSREHFQEVVSRMGQSIAAHQRASEHKGEETAETLQEDADWQHELAAEFDAIESEIPWDNTRGVERIVQMFHDATE